MTTPRDPRPTSSTSQSTDSSSESDVADSWTFFQRSSSEEVEPDEEADECSDPQASDHKDHPWNVNMAQEHPEKAARVCPRSREMLPDSLEKKDVNLSSCSLEGIDVIPRGSLIKSTFYTRNEQLSPISARHILVRDRLQFRKQDRGHRTLRSSLSRRLNEPLIEYVEDSSDVDAGQRLRRGSVQLSKSCSLDQGGSPVCLRPNFGAQKRSRSLDDSRRWSRAPAEWRKQRNDEKDEFDRDEFTDEEQDSNKQVLEEAEGEPENKELFSQLSLIDAETSLIRQIPQKDQKPYNESDEHLAASSGKTSELSLLEDSENEDMENVLKSLRQETFQSPSRQRASAPQTSLTLRRSSSAVPIRPAQMTPESREVLQRHSSAPALQMKPPSGKSAKSGLLKVFRRKSWTGQSTSQTDESGMRSGEGSQSRSPLMVLRKKMRASASSLSRMFTGQTSKVDKEEKRGKINDLCRNTHWFSLTHGRSKTAQGTVRI